MYLPAFFAGRYRALFFTRPQGFPSGKAHSVCDFFLADYSLSVLEREFFIWKGAGLFGKENRNCGYCGTGSILCGSCQHCFT